MPFILPTTGGSRNRGQLRTALQQYGYGTDTVTPQNEALDATNREVLGERRWWFLESQNTGLSTVVNVPTIDLSPIADLRDIDAVRIEVGTDYYKLRWLPVQQFRDYEHIDRDNGTPEFWTFYNNRLHLYPAPERVYALTIDYIIAAASLSDDASVSPIPATYDDVLVYGAVARMALREHDYFFNQLYEQKFQGALAKLRAEQTYRSQRQTSTHVVHARYWDDERRGLI